MKLYDDTVLKDAIDIHIHVGPDYMPRYADAITLAEEARDAGMKAIVVKCHLTSTVGAAQAACQAVPEVKTVGSIALNGTVGGLNPRSVKAAGLSGAGVVWLPTVDAQYAMDKAGEGHWIGHYVNGSNFGYPCARLSVTDGEGQLKEEVKEIIRICKEYDVLLCSGHIGPNECLAVAEYAKSIGFNKLEITHANAWFEDFSIDVLKRLADCGAVISCSLGAMAPHNGREDPREVVEIIREIGAGHVVLMTDYGQVNAPSPAQGMRVFYYLMLKMGITKEELELMMKKNPAFLLGLEAGKENSDVL